MREYLKLVLFLLGLICLMLSVTISWLCLIPTACFWLTLHLLNWFLVVWPGADFFDYCDPVGAYRE